MLVQALRTGTVWLGSSRISSIRVMDAFIGNAPDSGREQNE